jgi:peroxiredoxin-like protein
MPSLLEPDAGHRQRAPHMERRQKAAHRARAHNHKSNAEEKAVNMQSSYTYEVKTEWTGKRGGRLTAEGMPALEFSAPPEFAGEAGKWTPEHLLTAASASCLMATFLAIAEISKLELESLQMTVRAKLEKVPEEGYRFTEIILAPEIGVAAEDVEKAQRVLGKAEKNCFVNKSLRATVKVEPHFVTSPVGVSS